MPASSPTLRTKRHPAIAIARGAILLPLLIGLYLAGLGSVPLIDPDEGRYAEIPREMLADQDFVTPHLNGVAFLEKPPLYFWLESVSIFAFGLNETAFRLCSALFGLAGLAVAYILARSMSDRRSAWQATLILATSPLYIILAHLNTIDMTLSFFLTACLACFWLAHDRTPGRTGQLLYLGMFAASAGAVLSKGLIGIAIPGAVIAAYLLITGRWGCLKHAPWIAGITLFLLLALPWHALVALQHPEFLALYFVREHFLRFATSYAHAQSPYWYYAPVLLAGMLPWTGLLPMTIPLFRASSVRTVIRERPHLVFLALWSGIIVFLFSLSRGKLATYVLPALMPLAILAALAWREAIRARQFARLRSGLILSMVALGAIAMTLALVAAGKLTWLFAPVALAPFIPAAALFTCCAAAITVVQTLLNRPARSFSLAALSAASLFGCLWLAAPVIAETRSTRELASSVRTKVPPEADLFAYRIYPQSLPVYMERLIGVADWTGELGAGLTKLPEQERAHRFPSAREIEVR
ncbi:MAG TPA: glycosyltransferase family 39 protein, partial [Candidatus Polarisedimenticolia bacterium]|nr:glycosyltransferase family 39 protein [Candidatus Polarisedimenticolia bacterium]